MRSLHRPLAFAIVALLVVSSAAAGAVCLMGPACPSRGESRAVDHGCCAAGSGAPARGHETSTPLIPATPPTPPADSKDSCPSGGDCCQVSSDVPETAAASMIEAPRAALALGDILVARLAEPSRQLAELPPPARVPTARSAPIFLLDVAFLN